MNHHELDWMPEEARRPARRALRVLSPIRNFAAVLAVGLGGLTGVAFLSRVLRDGGLLTSTWAEFASDSVIELALAAMAFATFRHALAVRNFRATPDPTNLTAMVRSYRDALFVALVGTSLGWLGSIVGLLLRVVQDPG